MFIVECFLFFLREAGVDVPTVVPVLCVRSVLTGQRGLETTDRQR